MSRRGLVGAAFVLLCALALVGCGLFNQPPKAAFTVVYNVDPHDPLVVTLNASASADPDGDQIVAYLWTFGDDVTIRPKDYTSAQTRSVTTVRYPVQGAYDVSLVVRDEHGLDSVPAFQKVEVPHLPLTPTE